MFGNIFKILSSALIICFLNGCSSPQLRQPATVIKTPINIKIVKEHINNLDHDKSTQSAILLALTERSLKDVLEKNGTDLVSIIFTYDAAINGTRKTIEQYGFLKDCNNNIIDALVNEKQIFILYAENDPTKVLTFLIDNQLVGTPPLTAPVSLEDAESINALSKF